MNRRSPVPSSPASRKTTLWRTRLPGIVGALLGGGIAWGVSSAYPALPWLTCAVILGAVIGNVTGVRQYSDTTLKPGFDFSAKTLLRAGIVLLGLKLSLVDIAGLGWLSLLLIIGLVPVAFGIIWALGKAFRLPGSQPMLIAAGYSICGVSAIGAFAATAKTSRKEQATPIALVTLCGTVAIFVFPWLARPLGLDEVDIGRWVGAGVHDVGQVVATAGGVSAAALSAAVLVKLTRVIMLAPMLAVFGLLVRRRDAKRSAGSEGNSSARTAGTRAPIVPLFIVGFLVAIALRTLGIFPEPVLAAADSLQNILFAAALVALGANIKLGKLLTTDAKALFVGLLAWVVIAGLALGVVFLMP